MSETIQPLIITEEVCETFEITLDPVIHPTTYKRKMFELIHKSGLTEDEAKHFIDTTPFVLELLYDIDRGLFAVESEAVECIEIYNPYTGKEIPNENLSTIEKVED